MKKYISYFSIVSASMIMASCGGTTAEAPAEASAAEALVVELDAAQLQNAKLEIGRAQQASLNTTVRLNGVVDVPPQNIMSVSFPLGGFLKSTRLIPGMYVTKGEVVATMEDERYIQLQQDYLMAKAQVAVTEADFQRQKELNASKASSDKVYQSAKAENEKQHVLLKALSEKLRLTGINPDGLTESNLSRTINFAAPMSGFISTVNINPGKYVNPTDVMFEIMNTDDLHPVLKVFENDLDKLAIGQHLTITTNEHPDQKMEAEIILINHSLDQDRSAEVHCHFITAPKDLFPGMYITADVNVKNDSAFVLPDDAVVRWQNKTYVFSQKSSNTFLMKNIEVGLDMDSLVEVKCGDNVCNEDLVTKNAYTLLMKLMNAPEEE